MKKVLVYTLSFILITITVLALFSRFIGAGIRVSDGKYLGYSTKTSEWLFLEYQNIPVGNDGPYVFNKGGKRFAKYITGNAYSPATQTQIEVTDEIEVVVDNESNTKFTVKLKEDFPRSKLNIAMPDRLLAISDLEGDFDAMVSLLSANGVIDSSLDWIYGKSHLVLIGDMVDRGTNVVPLLWLIYKLETQAKQAGGEVHYVLGNHERYLLDGRVKSVAKKYYGTFRTTGLLPKDLWAENFELGRWLRSKPVVLKIGDILFVHGGISPRVLSKKLSLEEIDSEAKNNITIGTTINRNINDSILHGSDGILFYRNLAKDMTKYGFGKKATMEHVDQILLHFQVQKIAIGHTIVEHIGHDYNQKVLRVDVAHSDGIKEALLIKNGLLWVVDHKGKKSPLKKIKQSTNLVE